MASSCGDSKSAKKQKSHETSPSHFNFTKTCSKYVNTVALYVILQSCKVRDIMDSKLKHFCWELRAQHLKNSAHFFLSRATVATVDEDLIALSNSELSNLDTRR